MVLSRYDLACLLRRCPAPVLELAKKHPARVFVAGGYIRSVIASEDVLPYLRGILDSGCRYGS